MKDVMFCMNCFMAFVGWAMWLLYTHELVNKNTNKESAQAALVCLILSVLFTLSAVALA
jgi:hypothetical protein